MGRYRSDGFVEVADRCFVARYAQWDVNVGLVLGADRALVVDTRASSRQGEEVIADARRLDPHVPLAVVVNTHEHFDHWFGNGAFTDARIHAHESAAASMQTAGDRIKQLIRNDPELDSDHPEISAETLDDVVGTRLRLPDVTFSSASTVDLGERYVELIHPGRGHTSGDLVLTVPDVDLMFAGDLVEESADRDATPGFGSDCFPLDWPATLDLVVGMLTEQSIVVPGHGSLVDREFVKAQRADISSVAELIRSLASRGVPRQEALQAGAELGWPFAPKYLDQAVTRGYGQLGAASVTATDW
jgi:glyoxylase-like metal-dependent hydrolase (beta-lactamase superfamily II)